jgi:hypothetical protein
LEWVNSVVNGVIAFYEKVNNPPLFIFIIFLFFLMVSFFVYLPSFISIIKDYFNRKNNKKVEDVLKKDVMSLEEVLSKIIKENSAVIKESEKLVAILNKTLINLSESELNIIINLVIGNSSKEHSFNYYLTNLCFSYIEKDYCYRESLDEIVNNVLNNYKNLVIDRLRKFIIGDDIFFKYLDSKPVLGYEVLIRNFVLSLDIFNKREKLLIDEGKQKKEYLDNFKCDLRNLISNLIEELTTELQDVMFGEILYGLRNNQNTKFIIDEK